MANMNFGVNLLPKTTNTYTLGNSDKKWNLFVNEINGTTFTGIPDVSGFYTKPSGGIPASDLAETYLTASTEKWSDYTINVSNTLSYTSTLTILVKNNNSIVTHLASKTPTADYIPIYDNSAYLNSTTPSSGDSSTKVATTAFVDTYFAPKSYPIFTGGIQINAGNIASGLEVEANGNYSACFGKYVTALGQVELVSGEYNIQDTASAWAASTEYNVEDIIITASNQIFKCNVNHTSGSDFYTDLISHPNYWSFYTPNLLVIGNGTSANARSNALTLNHDGTGRYKGDLYVNCNADSTGGYKVATESYVTTAIANASLSDGGSSVTLATVATTGDYDDLINKPNLSQYLTSVPSLVGATSSVAGTAGLVPAPTTSDTDKFLRGDGTWATPSSGITGITLVSTSLTPSNGIVTIPAMTACSSSAAGATGAVPAPAAGDENKFLSGDGTWKAGGLPMVILSYGSSTWQSFMDAYNNNVIVYCRASSNANPASGSQTRMAFMAYVNNATDPTNVEFQYYRSVNPTSKSMSQLCDQVFIYKLDKTSGWSVTTREACIKTIEFAASSGLTGTYTTSNGKLTISAAS